MESLLIRCELCVEWNKNRFQWNVRMMMMDFRIVYLNHNLLHVYSGSVESNWELITIQNSYLRFGEKFHSWWNTVYSVLVGCINSLFHNLHWNFGFKAKIHLKANECHAQLKWLELKLHRTSETLVSAFSLSVCPICIRIWMFYKCVRFCDPATKGHTEGIISDKRVRNREKKKPALLCILPTVVFTFYKTQILWIHSIMH